MRHREHPRRPGQRPGLFVAGGQVPPEDFPSSPPAGTPLEDSAAVNLPAWDDVLDSADAVAAAIQWDREAAVEPYQVDLTRTMEDTTRMGNNLGKAIRDDMLGKAVRLEVGLDALREETLDRRGPGYPGDYPTDPVDGAELDPVDGLPIGQADDDGEQLEELDATRLVFAAPPPPPVVHYSAPRPTPEEELRAELEPTPMQALVREAVRREDVAAAEELGGLPLPMSAARAASTRGIPARVLNWTSRHDPASLEYGVRQRLRAPAPLMDRLWAHGPILDQGTAPPLSLHDASGCTGHAGVNAANVLTLAAHTGPGDVVAPLDSGAAMRLYERAQVLDDVPGEAYPGTSVLALMKAGQEAGYWGAYLWAFGTRDIAQAILQVGPVIVGIPWLAGMTDPGPDGIVTVEGDDQGGHALCLFAIKMVVAGRPGPWFGALQTWGEGVGDHGVIWFHHKDLARLLHGVGEAAIPVADI